jgi:hypothetical protein
MVANDLLGRLGFPDRVQKRKARLSGANELSEEIGNRR